MSKHILQVEDGKILWTPEEKERWRRSVENIATKYAVITIEPRRNKRSQSQNSYYWGAVIPFLLHEMGEQRTKMSEERIHDWLRSQFLSEVIDFEFINRETNEVKTISDRVSKSTTSLTVGEFVEYIMKIEMWAQDFLGTQRLPDPEEYYQSGRFLSYD